MADSRPRSKAPLVAAVVAGIVAILVVRSISNNGAGGPSPVETAAQTAAPRAACTGVTIAASSEKAALLGQIAADYEKGKPEVRGRCVDVSVASKASGGAAEALARGWNVAVDGPRPDVWSPAASTWVVILRQRLAARDAANIVPAQISKVAQSPLVIAMPRPMAQALGWPDKAVGWSDILSLARDPAGWGKFNHPEWGSFRLGKTNPNFSTSGLHATVGAYYAATSRSTDLTEADLTDPRVVEFVKGVESSVVHYGDITLTFLENLQKADDRGVGLSYISAVTVEEKSVWDYNKGNPTGDPATLGRHAPPKTPLAAIYPKEGTLLSDHPYVILNAPWVNAAKKAAAGDFLKFLQTPGPQQRFKKAAFRDYKGAAGGEIRQANGLLPKQPDQVIAPPAPPVLDKLQKSWADLRKRARIMVVIDVSGSMGEAVPNSGSTKLELAKAAASKALDQLAPDDELALWIFSSELERNTPYLELVPMSKVSDRIDLVKQRIAGLVPRSGTALYATTRAAVRKMQADRDPSRINAVVLLTDGRNEYPADTDLNGLIRSLRSEGEETTVRVFTIGYGENADLSTLERIAEASRAAAYNASDPASIDKVFTAVISNF